MSCTNPLTAYQLKEYQGETSPLVFPKPPLHEMHLYNQLKVGCSKCIGCLKIRSMTKAIQLHCELQTTEGYSWFITLTYDDDHIPDNLSLYKPHITNFIKALRRHREKYKHSGKFRYEQVGEYGTKTLRPHHHMAAFNLQLDDLELYSDNGKYKQYVSKLIEKKWSNGSVIIQELNFSNCLYIAQHSDKKIGNTTPNHEPEVLDAMTGEISKDRVPEYSTRSSNPGIGALWYQKYGDSDLYNTDSIVINGREYKIPPYFDKQLKKHDPELFAEIKEIRKQNAVEKTDEENQQQNRYNEAIYKQKKRETV